MKAFNSLQYGANSPSRSTLVPILSIFGSNGGVDFRKTVSNTVNFSTDRSVHNSNFSDNFAADAPPACKMGTSFFTNSRSASLNDEWNNCSTDVSCGAPRKLAICMLDALLLKYDFLEIISVRRVSKDASLTNRFISLKRMRSIWFSLILFRASFAISSLANSSISVKSGVTPASSGKRLNSDEQNE